MKTVLCPNCSEPIPVKAVTVHVRRIAKDKPLDKEDLIPMPKDSVYAWGSAVFGRGRHEPWQGEGAAPGQRRHSTVQTSTSTEASLRSASVDGI